MINAEVYSGDMSPAVPIHIAPGGSKEMVQLVQSALSLQAEISARDAAVLSSPNELVPMPRQPQYGAGDVLVTATEIRSIGVMMYEVELNPDDALTGDRPRSYSFVLSIQATAEGVRLYKETSPRVNIRDTNDSSAQVKHISGPSGWRAQEVIVQRASRQLRTARLSKNLLG